MKNELFKEEVTIKPNWDLIVTGTKFEASIEGTNCEGRILREDGRVFLCQNEKSGTQGSSTLGYSYSWVIDIPIYPNDIIFTSFKLDPDFVDIKPEVLKIDNYICKINSGHIMVGCTRVNNELVREIASKLIDEEPTKK